MRISGAGDWEGGGNFDQLVLSHLGLIRSIGLSTLRRLGELDDFTQQVVLVAFAHRNELDPRGVKGWLATVARNTAIQWSRKRTPDLLAQLPDIPLPTPLPDESLEAEERWSQVIEGLASLDDTDERALRAHYLEDRGYEQMQREFGVSYSAMRKRVSRARKLLQERLTALAGLIGLIGTRRQPRGFGDVPGGDNRMTATISLTASMLIVGWVGVGAHELEQSAWRAATFAPQGDTLLPIELVAEEFRPKVKPVADGVGEAEAQPFPAAPSMGTWTRLDGAPDERAAAAATAIDDRLYVFAGIDTVGPRDATLVYDTRSHSWDVSAAIPTARSYFSAGVIDGKTYVAGGLGTPGQWTALSSLEVHDPVTDSWDTLADMPTARGKTAAAVAGGKLYVLGGWASGPNLRTNEAYDPATGQWEARADMPEPNAWHSAVAIRGEIYVLGGQGLDHNADDLRSLFIYIPATNTWREGAPMPETRTRFMACVVGGRIYTIGGWIGDPNAEVTAVVHVYDPVSDSWDIGPDMPTAGHDLFGTALDGRIYVIGGWDQRAGVFEVLDTGFRAISPSGKDPSTWGGLKRL